MKRSLLPLNALRAFDAAARQESFTKAAKELSVTPAAVSLHIRSLEEYLGVSLFTRNKNTLSLTPQGKRALEPLEEGFLKFEEAVKILQNIEEENDLRISVSPSFASKWMIPRLERFYEEHKDIAIRLSASMDLVDFKSDNFDLSVRYGSGNYPGLYVEELLREEVFPVCSPDLIAKVGPIKTYEDLLKVPLIHDDSSLEDESCPRWEMWLKKAGMEVPKNSQRIHFNTTQLAVEAAIAGRGVALAKRTIAETDIEAGRLNRLFTKSLPVDFAYYIVCEKHRRDEPKIRALIRWLREEAISFG